LLLAAVAPAIGAEQPAPAAAAPPTATSAAAPVAPTAAPVAPLAAPVAPLAAPAAPLAATAVKPARAPGITSLRDGVIAVVDGEPITLRELKLYGITGAPFLPPDVRGDYHALLDSMIEHRLLKAEYEKNGIVANDQMVDRYIAGVLEESHQTRAQLELDIAKAGLSWKDYHERMREEVQRIQLVNLLIRARVNVPEEEVRRAWEDDPQYLESEKLEVAAIYLPVTPGSGDTDKAREQAAEVEREARKDFEAAARKYSKGPAASEGGHLGEFKRGTMAAHFEKALQGLKAGEVSQPVEGPGGLYIVKIVKILSAGRRNFDDVKQALSEKLYDKRLSERYQKWATEDLRKDHRVDILIDRLAVIAADS
jgi:parvulin-like peptidyl-prolyl isomerase